MTTAARSSTNAVSLLRVKSSWSLSETSRVGGWRMPMYPACWASPAMISPRVEPVGLHDGRRVELEPAALDRADVVALEVLADHLGGEVRGVHGNERGLDAGRTQFGQRERDAVGEVRHAGQVGRDRAGHALDPVDVEAARDAVDERVLQVGHA
jgi:hypothetical protein